MDKIGIILVNYNTCKDTIECIDSLKKISYKNYMIIVVDNCSTDQSFKKLKKIKNIDVVQSGRNGGFAYGNNIGIKYALTKGCDQVLLLNNDTVVEPDFLDYLVQENKNDTVGIVAPKILNYYNQEMIWSAGGVLNWNLFVGYNRLCGKKDQKLKEKSFMEFVNGCCMLIKKEVIDTIGYLPEEYFMYYEDLDYCIQVRKHFKIVYTSYSVIYHKVSVSSGLNSPFMLEWVNRSQLKFMRKYKDYVGKKYTRIKIEIYLRKYLRLCAYLLQFDFSRAHALFKGISC